LENVDPEVTGPVVNIVPSVTGPVVNIVPSVTGPEVNVDPEVNGSYGTKGIVLSEKQVACYSVDIKKRFFHFISGKY
jgi:hypothetical protein